jgi:heterodisulfide reductase subunit C
MSKLNFGFTVSKPHYIDLDCADSRLADELAKREPSFRLCIQCGSCTGTCSTGQFTPFSIRHIHLMIQRGELHGLANMLEKCMLCGKCKLVCPRGVNTRNVIVEARKLLSDKSFNPKL